MRTAYFILGMHRSGTSALASTIHGLGVTLGDSLLPASEDNPKGYFENKAVQEFNESFLVASGFGWDDVFFDIHDVAESDYQRLVLSASRILEHEFGAYESFAVKDPRICILLPVWLDACRKLDIKPRIILAHRNPLEIAESLKKRNGMSVKNALALWADHMFKAELYSRGLDRVLVSYDDLLNNFSEATSSLSSFIGETKSNALKSDAVIDTSLRHHSVKSKALNGVPKCISELLKQYEKGDFSSKIMDSAMSEFSMLKSMFFNDGKRMLFQQVFEERRKYKLLKDDNFDKLQASNKKLNSLVEESTLLKKELNRHAKESEKLAQTNAKLQQLELAYQHKQQKLEILQKDIELRNEQVKDLRASVEKRDESIRNAAEKNKTFDKENLQLRNALHKLEIDNKYLVQKIEALNSKIESVELQAKVQADKFKQTIGELEKVNTALVDDINKLDKKVASSQSEFESLKQDYDKLTSDLETAYSELSAVQQKYEVLFATEKMLRKELSSANANLQNIQMEAEQEVLAHKNTKRSLNASLEEKNQVVERFNEQAKKIESAHESTKRLLDASLEEKNQIVERLNERAKQIESAHESTKRLLDASLEEKNQIIEGFKEQSKKIESQFVNWAELLVSPMAKIATDYAKSKLAHSNIRATLTAAMLSRRLEQAANRFNENMQVASKIPFTFVINFDEQGYFTCNEDVEVAVGNGEFQNGLEHFLKFGFDEAMQGKRKIHPKAPFFNPESFKEAEIEAAFDGYLKGLYDNINKRKALTQPPVDGKAHTKQEKANEYVEAVTNVPGKKLARRPAPNHISALKSRPSVDIILPVYNALEDVKACIESLYNNETLPFNLIIIDDCSEEETKSWLESAQKEYGFKLSRNTENLRFTKTVNKGFSQSEGDFVVLLNSDTIVTAYWLEKILCCFESDKKVGIVGPLSNAASWQTVPVREDKVNGGWLVNEIPEGYSIELMGQLVETISQRQYPNVPSVNGFCYVIKRDVINQIGTLDEEYFPTGYGEEDDFSIRARKAGYTIRVADDTYVFHAKSKSYTKEVRKVLTVGGRKSLDKKHGKEEIEKLIAAWKAEPLLPEIGKEIESFMQISSGNKKVVFTAIFGNYDNLKTPEYINPDWDYVCFTDNKNVESDVFTIKHVNQRFENVTKNARMIKLLSHLFLINYEYSLWIDGSVKLRGKNIDELVNHNLSANYISLHNHVKRDCVYEEADACMLAKKDGNDILARQIAEYRNEGLPESVGVFETAEIARRQWAPEVQMLNSLWWQQLDAFSIRDQVALPFVFWKHNFTSFVMEGNQWLDAYFHMYKHRASQSKHNTAVELLVHVESTDTDVTALIDNIFEKTNYTNFVVKVLLSNSVTLNDSGKRALQQRFGNSLAFVEETKHLSPSDLNGVVKGGKTELCCLLSEDIKLFNSDWLDVLVDGVANDENVTFVGPTILNEEFDFVASSVRVKRKQGELKEVFNARKVGGTGAVLAIHQSCILFNRQHFVRLGGFNSAFTTLRSAAIELFHRNTKDKKHTLLASNSEVIIKNDCEEVEMDLLARLLK